VEDDLPDQRSLVQQAKAGDAEAFDAICRTCESRLFHQALTLCGNVTLAQELAQETLVEAWKHLRRYNGRCQFFTWLCAILINRHRNALREKRPVPFSALAAPAHDELQNRIDHLPAHESMPDEAALLHERALLVWKCIEALPPKHKQVIYLRFYVGDSLEGIAAALGCSVGTVKSRLFHALDKLRSMNTFPRQFQDNEVGVGIL
jgi:RNA polymerase sigma-70 factor (ECF subfamily)